MATMENAIAKDTPDPQERTSAWVFSLQRSAGGVPKLATREAQVTSAGLDGDQQRNLEHHGGPDRALCLYALERITALQREGHPVFPGALGENITLAGLDWASIGIGTRLRIGSAVVEVTDYASPCRTIMSAFFDRRYGRVSQKKHPGWSRLYARVLTVGVIHVADEVTADISTP